MHIVHLNRQSRRVHRYRLARRRAYVVAAVGLALGLVVGYSFISEPTRLSPRVPVTGGHAKITLDQMKQMADVQASTLVEKSKSEPNNAALLVQIATIYQSKHQFKEASEYFERALKIDPKNASARTELASCLYYSGNVDGALDQ